MNFFLFLKILYNVKKFNPEIIQYWMYHPCILSIPLKFFVNAKTIWSLHHSNFDYNYNKISTVFIINFLAFFSFLVPNKIICCSIDSIKNHILIGYDKNKFEYIPNGYDSNKFYPNKIFRHRLRHELKINDSEFVIGMVARYDPQKDFSSLIQALSLFSKYKFDFKVILVGNNIDYNNNELTELIDYYDLDNILLLGLRNDIEYIMNGLDFSILSSVGESFPNVISESMLCGTPCIATNVGDICQIISDYGWISPPKDPISLSLSIKFAYDLYRSDDKNELLSLKNSCRRHISNNFSIQKLYFNYNNIWLKLA